MVTYPGAGWKCLAAEMSPRAPAVLGVPSLEAKALRPCLTFGSRGALGRNRPRAETVVNPVESYPGAIASLNSHGITSLHNNTGGVGGCASSPRRNGRGLYLEPAQEIDQSLTRASPITCGRPRELSGR